MDVTLARLRTGLRLLDAAPVAHAALGEAAGRLAASLGAGLAEEAGGMVVGLAGKAAHAAEFGRKGCAPHPVLAPAAAAAAPELARAIAGAMEAHLRETLGAR